MPFDEGGGEVDGARDVLFFPWFERVIAGKPGDLDRRRQLVPIDFGRCPERIALALDDERRRPQRGEVFGAQFLRLAGRVRSEEHTSELQSRVDISYAVFC